MSMIIDQPPLGADRRIFVASGLAWLLSSAVAGAQSAVLTPAKLQRLIQLAFAQPDTTPIARPHVLGFTEDRLTTRSIERGDEKHKHGLMVVIPQHTDGLVLFEGR